MIEGEKVFKHTLYAPLIVSTHHNYAWSIKDIKIVTEAVA